jgi:hypothetical protein
MKAEKLVTQIGASQADKMAATKMAAQREDMDKEHVKGRCGQG